MNRIRIVLALALVALLFSACDDEPLGPTVPKPQDPTRPTGPTTGFHYLDLEAPAIFV